MTKMSSEEVVSEVREISHGRAKVRFDVLERRPELFFDIPYSTGKVRCYGTDYIRDLAACLNWVAHIIDSKEEDDDS